VRVSSIATYAFASHVSGCLPIMTEGVRHSAYSPVKRAFRPGRAGRMRRTPFVTPRQGIQPAQCHDSRRLNRYVVDWFSQICHDARSQSEALVPSKTAFLSVKTPVLPATVIPRMSFMSSPHGESRGLSPVARVIRRPQHSNAIFKIALHSREAVKIRS
jgi:hypothetical protein